MPLFNSQGSNYDFRFAVYALMGLALKRRDAVGQLQRRLKEMYGGEVTTFYKGRDAIEYGLRCLGVGKDDVVLTQGFACYAIEEAITRVGAMPGYVDVERKSLNLSPATLDVAYQQYPGAKAVLVQHTLGYPADIEGIRRWCRERKMWLIEDLAQSMGGSDLHGEPLGSKADVVVLSFGKDKVVDGVSGGAAVVRGKGQVSKVVVDAQPPKIAVMKNLVYPLLMWLIRMTDVVLVGKVIHRLARMVGFIPSPVESPTRKMTRLPSPLAVLALRQLGVLDERLEHRRRVAETYLIELADVAVVTEKQVAVGANLRFPIAVEDVDGLIAYLKTRQIHIADRWYRKAVDSGALDRRTVYRVGSCPWAERRAQAVVNLPTHQGVSIRAASALSHLIVGWLADRQMKGVHD